MEDIYNRPSTCDLPQLCMHVSFYLLTTLTTLSVYDRYLKLSFYLSQLCMQVSFYLLTTLSVYDRYLQLSFFMS
jgi:hypothetical protein